MLGQREDAACLAIADAVRAQPTLLATICLRANYIGREGATALVNAARSNAVLRMLDLRDNEISGDVVRELAGILSAPPPPTQPAKGMANGHKIPGMPSSDACAWRIGLTSLRLKGNPVDAPAAAYFKERLSRTCPTVTIDI